MHEPEIEYLIRSLGIGATYRGYEYLIYGIRLCLSDENYLLFVSKYLYPDIARHYNTTSYSVERDIPHCHQGLLGARKQTASRKNCITPFNSETNLR